jgi:hypothetical protein
MDLGGFGILNFIYTALFLADPPDGETEPISI